MSSAWACPLSMASRILTPTVSHHGKGYTSHNFHAEKTVVDFLTNSPCLGFHPPPSSKQVPKRLPAFTDGVKVHHQIQMLITCGQKVGTRPTW